MAAQVLNEWDVLEPTGEKALRGIEDTSHRDNGQRAKSTSNIIIYNNTAQMVREGCRGTQTRARGFCCLIVSRSLSHHGSGTHIRDAR